MEASREIARQLKLRDLGGLIVIDFIDMEIQKNQRQVEEELAKSVDGDRARIQFGKISRFGLLEMSRQRLRPSLEESSGLACPRCNGQGTIRGVESIALSIVRLIQEEAMRADILEVHVQLPLSVAIFLSNEKRHLIAEIETQNKIRIILIPNPNIETPHYELTKVVKSSDETRASYQMQVPAEVEQFVPTAHKLKAVEQPAIRELSIVKAPVKSRNLKRGFSSFLNKIQEVFAPKEEEKKQTAPLTIRAPNDRHPQGERQQGRPERSEQGSGNRNNDRRRGGGNRNNPRRDRDQRDPNREPREARPPRDNNRPLQVNAPAPQQRPAADKPKPILIDFTATSPATPVDAKPFHIAEISPAVKAILSNAPASKDHSKQVESASPASVKNAKIVKEEVIEKINFSVDDAREAVKKEHSKVGTRVETTVAKPKKAPSKKYVKDVSQL